MTCDCESEVELGPTAIYNLTHLPTVYIIFLSIGLVLVIIQAYVIIPHYRKVRSAAIDERDRLDLPLEPISYRFVKVIILLPLLVSLTKMLVLLSPITEYTMEFLSHTYEAACLFIFSRLLVMYLGSRRAIYSLSNSEPSKYWAVPPYACCFKPCCKAKHVTPKDFRLIYWLILQYAILAPILSFVELLRAYSDNQAALKGVSAIGMVSAMTCIYGLFAMLRASHALLHRLKIHGKFWAIKGAVLGMIIPQFLFSFTGVPSISNEHYSDEVAEQAWASFITIVILVFLSPLFVKYFTTEDASLAYKAHEAKALVFEMDQVSHQTSATGLKESKQRESVNLSIQSSAAPIEEEHVSEEEQPTNVASAK